jgi:divalent metal cation (Fe/Co/Zn/Cd) transporter
METKLQSGAGPVVSTILLMAGILLLAAALRQFLTGEDADAPPPRWLAVAAAMKPRTAFGFGMLLVALGGKWWLFTLGAVAAIADADLGHLQSAVDYLVFVALAELPVLLIVVGSALAPQRSAPVLDAISTWLEEHNHGIVIAACLVFGVWFVVKALNDFGVI